MIAANNHQKLFKARTKIAKILLIFCAPFILVTAPIWPNPSMAHALLPAIGDALVVVGILIRVYTSLYSGGRKNAVLVTEGPYSIVRNPLYVGSFFAVTGLGLITGSLVLTVLLAASFFFLHIYTVMKEEAFLQDRFGEDYRRYCQNVPRWIPSFSLWKKPDEILVRPDLVLYTMRDALFFVLLLILLEAVCAMRDAGTFPIMIQLP